MALPMSSLFAPLCLIAAALTWYAGVSVERVPLGALRGSVAAARHPGYDAADDRDTGRGGRRGDPRHDDLDDGEWDRDAEWRGPDQTGTSTPTTTAARASTAAAGCTATSRRGPGRRPSWARTPATATRTRTTTATARGDYDSREVDAAVRAGRLRHRQPERGGGRAGPRPEAGAGPGCRAGPGSGRGPRRRPGGARPQASREELFGQIAIYTLIEERASDFDRLTERVVEQVRAGEPDTLVFIVHAVPSAPMQRILYEVYRDRAAFDWHRRQPYIAQFEADRRPYVLATNVIELGLQQAKVSPFPSIADLFGEPGYDTSGFERPDYTREYGSPSRLSAERGGRGGPVSPRARAPDHAAVAARLPPVRGGPRGHRAGGGRPGRALVRAGHHPVPGGSRAVLGDDPGHLHRRRAARLLAGQRGPAAGRAA